jgi:hypothetical protein
MASLGHALLDRPDCPRMSSPQLTALPNILGGNLLPRWLLRARFAAGRRLFNAKRVGKGKARHTELHRRRALVEVQTTPTAIGQRIDEAHVGPGQPSAVTFTTTIQVQ